VIGARIVVATRNVNITVLACGYRDLSVTIRTTQGQWTKGGFFEYPESQSILAKRKSVSCPDIAGRSDLLQRFNVSVPVSSVASPALLDDA
jgi:hypothetical protein